MRSVSPAPTVRPLRVDRPAARKRSRFGWRRGVLCTLGVLALVAWQGNQRTRTEPATGTSLQLPDDGVVPSPVADANARRFRIGSFNIHGGKGTDRVRDLSRIADCLQGLDLVGLNEVHGPRLLQWSDQAEALGDQLDMPWLFVPSDRRWWNDDFGNGVVSALPATHWQRINLPDGDDDSHRTALLLHVQVGGETVHVLITHTTNCDGGPNGPQVRSVAELFLSLAEPAILLGDLNATRDYPHLTELLSTPGVGDPLHEVLGENDPPHRIDWIITRGLECRDAGLVDNGASDHPLVWAELELPSVEE